MKRRITIYLDVELAEKLKDKQANLVQKSKHAVSFSQVLNEALRESFS